MPDKMKRLALISVTDKTGVVEFAQGLVAHGFDILSTGGTAERLRGAGIAVTPVGEFTGQPEILDGRVKTLHPKIHGGLLGNPGRDMHRRQMEDYGIVPIEVLAVNLYPFEQTVMSGGSLAEAIENIDIGGPAMIRAAAKNADRVLVVVDPRDYPLVLGAADDNLRKRLQAKAFAHTAYYDSLIAEYLSSEAPSEPGDTLTVGMRLVSKLRYGENPHQDAGVYVRPFSPGGIPRAEQLWGKQLSYNNFLDADAAWELALELQRGVGPAFVTVIVKHGNPCGAAWSKDAAESFHLARAGDPVSAFGGIVAIPGPLTMEAANAMTEKGNFFEVIIAGEISEQVLDVFKKRSGWGQDVRILRAPENSGGGYLSLRSIRGGVLVQDADVDDQKEWRTVTKAEPTEKQLWAMRRAWTIAKHVKSNAIVIASESRLMGVGAGQMNRVQSVRLAIEAAGSDLADCALASDAFFPFADSIETAAAAGIHAVVQPGGSKKDSDVIEAADRLRLCMVFTGARHFRH